MQQIIKMSENILKIRKKKHIDKGAALGRRVKVSLGFEKNAHKNC